MSNRDDFLFALPIDVAFGIFDLEGAEGYDKLINRMYDKGINVTPIFGDSVNDSMLIFLKGKPENVKLNLLNKFELYDWSCCGNECEYVVAKVEPEDIQLLYAAGFTKEQVQEAFGDYTDEGILDLSILGFQYADANWWSSKTGFIK